ncbi:MAG: Hsp20/alpha crystallin family protein [Planctomycetia bacterium]|nr:Hsp20/alpha crystallin family protein [Planctomycetia bacterium]
MPETNALVKKQPTEVTIPEVTRGGMFYTPRVDIYESTDEVVLQCDMPGVKPNDVEVRFEKGELSLHGKVSARPTPGDYVNEEYGIGDFYRTFSISPEIETDRISAHYRDGVLTVHLPKVERMKPKKITVHAG